MSPTCKSVGYVESGTSASGDKLALSIVGEGDGGAAALGDDT
jgi:hypothetical protein